MPVEGSQRPAEPALPPQPLQAKQEVPKETGPAKSSTSGKPAARGLTWRGCWGCSSSEIGIYVLATMVGHIHLQALGEGNEAEYKAALQDVRRLLQESLPASAVLANVNWARACPQARGRMAEVAIVGTSTACQRLQSQWQGKKLCGGLVVATWTSLNDTASEKHVERMAEMASKELKGPRRRTLALELPARWVEGQAPKQVNQLSASSQWYRFCALFGEVQTLELVRPMGTHSIVQLLISYKEPEFAGAFREALTDRYLIFVNSSIPDDCYSVSCVPGDGYSLREYFCSGAFREKKSTTPVTTTAPTPGPAAPNTAAPAVAQAAALGTQTPKAPAPVKNDAPAVGTTGGFLLRRCGQGDVPGALRPAPETFEISKPRLDFGREDTCDVVLRHQHVSKVHAVFVLQTLPEGAGDMLLMQDSSSNGTWINGQRMTQGRFHQLQPGDRVSFLQPSGALEEDVATWQVGRDPSVVVTFPSSPPPAAPSPAPKEPKKKVVDPAVREAVPAPVAPAQAAQPVAARAKKLGPTSPKAAKAPKVATAPETAPESQASPSRAKPAAPAAERPKAPKRKAPEAPAPPVAPKAMPVKRPAPPEASAVPQPPGKVRAAAKTQGRKTSRISKPPAAPTVSPSELAMGYAALAAAYAQAAAEEETQVEVPVLAAAAAAAFQMETVAAPSGEPNVEEAPTTAPNVEEVAPALPPLPALPSPPWRAKAMQLPPPPKSAMFEVLGPPVPCLGAASPAAEAAGQVLSQIRSFRPKSRPVNNGAGTPRITPYLDMPRSGPAPPTKPAEEVSDGLASNDIVTWARAWKLEHYEEMLLRNYDDVDQIVSLHSEDLTTFFEDNAVEDEADRWAFTHAIQARQALAS